MAYTNEDLYKQQERLARRQALLQNAALDQAEAHHAEMLAQQRAAATQQARHNYSMWIQTPDGRYYQEWERVAVSILDLAGRARATMSTALAADANRVLSPSDFARWQRTPRWSPSLTTGHLRTVAKTGLRAFLISFLPVGFFIGGAVAGLADSFPIGFVVGAAVSGLVGGIAGHIHLRSLRKTDRAMHHLMEALNLDRHAGIPWARDAASTAAYLEALETVADAAFTHHPAPHQLPDLVLPPLRPSSDFPAGSMLAHAVRQLEPMWILSR